MGLLYAYSRGLVVEGSLIAGPFFKGGCQGVFILLSSLSAKLTITVFFFFFSFRSKLASVIKDFQLFG